MSDTATEIGTYRPASRLRDGWHIRKSSGEWVAIEHCMQITAPLGVAELTLADGSSVGVPHSREVLCRTAAEIKRAAKAAEQS